MSDDASSGSKDWSEAQDASADSQDAKNASMIKRVMIGSAPLRLSHDQFSHHKKSNAEQALTQ